MKAERSKVKENEVSLNQKKSNQESWESAYIRENEISLHHT